MAPIFILNGSAHLLQGGGGGGGASIKHTKRINIAYKQTKWARESCKRFNFVKGCDGCINLVKL